MARRVRRERRNLRFRLGQLSPRGAALAERGRRQRRRETARSGSLRLERQEQQLPGREFRAHAGRCLGLGEHNRGHNDNRLCRGVGGQRTWVDKNTSNTRLPPMRSALAPPVRRAGPGVGGVWTARTDARENWLSSTQWRVAAQPRQGVWSDGKDLLCKYKDGQDEACDRFSTLKPVLRHVTKNVVFCLDVEQVRSRVDVVAQCAFEHIRTRAGVVRWFQQPVRRKFVLWWLPSQQQSKLLVPQRR